jgi:hypothetical protein
VRDMGPTNEKLLYISEMTGQLLRLSDEMNLCTLSYLLRMARLEAETAGLKAPPTLKDRLSPNRRAN